MLQTVPTEGKLWDLVCSVPGRNDDVVSASMSRSCRLLDNDFKAEFDHDQALWFKQISWEDLAVMAVGQVAQRGEIDRR